MANFLSRTIMQEYQDLLIWEQFFNEHPIKTFIELGTGHGGSSLYFGLQCYQRKISFHTFDNVQSIQFERPLEQIIELHKNYKTMDLFSDEGKAYIAHLIENSVHPIAIFFDNGNKPMEWRLFAPLTSPGDFCIVHDWGTEFTEENIGNVPVQRILSNESDKRITGWKAMWFMRTP